jgi:hypothetical protein
MLIGGVCATLPQGKGVRQENRLLSPLRLPTASASPLLGIEFLTAARLKLATLNN